MGPLKLASARREDLDSGHRAHAPIRHVEGRVGVQARAGAPSSQSGTTPGASNFQNFYVN